MIIKDLQRYIDHTNLKPEADFNDIVKLCEEAKKYGFAAVCINPCFVQTAKKELNGSGVKVCTVIGFPLGACHTSVKVFEAETAVLQGADEIDMVINIGWLKSGQIDFLTNEIKEVVQGVKGKAIVKVIIECCLLTNYEKVVACNASLNGGADYVKTSTGFSVGGATVEDVILMKEAVGNKMKVKAAGGIRDINVAAKMIDAGADRIGTSVGVKLIEESNNGMEC